MFHHIHEVVGLRSLGVTLHFDYRTPVVLGHQEVGGLRDSFAHECVKIDIIDQMIADQANNSTVPLDSRLSCIDSANPRSGAPPSLLGEMQILKLR